MVTLTLRPMSTADLPAVVALEKELFGADAWSARMLTGELAEQPRSRCYLVAQQPAAGEPGAAESAEIVGYGGLLTAGDQADVLTLGVSHASWGRGVGSALLVALIAEAARRGCAEVFLEVRTDNERAQQLYRRHGFVPVGIRAGYYQPTGGDALVMRLSLHGATGAER